MSVPKWLKERLGTPTRGRGCRAAKCAFGCRQDVLAGFDEDIMAQPAIVDPVALSPLGEAIARIEGRRTYKLARHNDGQALWLRMDYNIAAHPASETTIVVAAHVCNGSNLPSLLIKPKPVRKGLPDNAEPPF